VKVRIADDEFIIVTSTKDKPRDMVETIGALVLWLGLGLDIRIEHRMIVIKHPNRLKADPWDEVTERRHGERRRPNGSDRRHVDRRHGYP
jgi:hypothetical protein